MTQTESRQTQAAYRGVIYGIDLLDHHSVMASAPRVVVNDYVGKTRQRGRTREMQHRDKQPFSDLIVGSPRVLWEGICTEDELDAMERHFIREVEERPRMNEKMNEDNLWMVSKEDQLAQRHARDDAAGRARWQYPRFRRRESLLEWEEQVSAQPAPVQRQSITVWLTPQRIKTGLWSSAWATTAGTTWANLDAVTLWQLRLALALLAATFLLVWVRAGMPVTKAQRRRVRQRIRKHGLKRWRRW